MAQGTDVIGWEIERGGHTAVVREDGVVESDDATLRDYLQARLREPVTVYRRGTVARSGGTPADAIRLVPGDGRYTVARVRSLPGEDPALQIVRIIWTG
ncbi:MAG TPA: hypothetical protein VMV23_12245 [Candidatus Nanopelagicaceae bacterium]|nr:hypothetical protein [Candidatus Nanopelagicaceae bacterium]